MKITAELSLYPLADHAVERIVAFIEDLKHDAGHDAGAVEIVINQLSTQISGELDEVFELVRRALEHSFGSGGSQVLVAKFLNAGLPITEAPDLGGG